jgi:hypothetical protein
MRRPNLLLIDAIINLLLGILLLIYTDSIILFLGVPNSNSSFYPNILGAVLFGIGIALIFQYFRGSEGLGFYGAIAINISGGIVLAFWLLFGKLVLPLHGFIFLWILVIVLVGISSLELIYRGKQNI